jgi:hypothetical protein
VTVAAALGAEIARAQEPPALRRGAWEYTRTVQGMGQPIKATARKDCASPTEEMRQQRETLSKSGCRFADVARAGGTYRFTATCPAPGGSGSMVSRSVLTARGDAAYTVTVDSEGTIGGKTTRTHEELVARQVGDCQ